MMNRIKQYKYPDAGGRLLPCVWEILLTLVNRLCLSLTQLTYSVSWND